MLRLTATTRMEAREASWGANQRGMQVAQPWPCVQGALVAKLVGDVGVRDGDGDGEEEDEAW